MEGVYKLNVAFVANLFNNHPALDKPDDIDFEAYDHIEESREEKSESCYHFFLYIHSQYCLQTQIFIEMFNYALNVNSCVILPL